MLRRHIAPAELMVVVKADAYGHGLLPIARSAVSAGVSLIGVLDAAVGTRAQVRRVRLGASECSHGSSLTTRTIRR